MTPTVENPACRPEEQRKEQESQNRPSSQDKEEGQNYDGDCKKEKSEQENNKDWIAYDALQNPAKPHPPTSAESVKRKRSGCPPTGEPHQTQQRENWHKPKEQLTSPAYLLQKNTQEDGRDGGPGGETLRRTTGQASRRGIDACEYHRNGKWRKQEP